MGTHRSGAKKLYKAKKHWVALGLATGAAGLLAVAPATVGASDAGSAAPAPTAVAQVATTTTGTPATGTESQPESTATSAATEVKGATAVAPAATTTSDTATTPATAPTTTAQPDAETAQPAAEAPAADETRGETYDQPEPPSDQIRGNAFDQPGLTVSSWSSDPQEDQLSSKQLTSISFDFTPSGYLAQQLEAAGYNRDELLNVVHYGVGERINVAASDSVHLGALDLPTKSGYDIIWYYNQDLWDGKSEDQVYHHSNYIPAHTVTFKYGDQGGRGITVHYFKKTRVVPVNLLDTDGHLIKRVTTTVKNAMPPLSWVRNAAKNPGVDPFQYTTELTAPTLDGYAAVTAYQKLTATTEYLYGNDFSWAAYQEEARAQLLWNTHAPSFTYVKQNVLGTHTYTDATGKKILETTHEEEALPLAPNINGYELDPFKSTFEIRANNKETYPNNPTGKPDYLGGEFEPFAAMIGDPENHGRFLTALMYTPYLALQASGFEARVTSDPAALSQISTLAKRYYWRRTPGDLFNLAIAYYKGINLTMDMGVAEQHAAKVEVITHYVYKAVPHDVAEPTGVMSKTVTYTISFTGIDHEPLTVTQTFTKDREATPTTRWTPEVELPDVAGYQHLSFLPAADVWGDLNRTDFSATIDYRPGEQTLVVSFQDAAGNKLAEDQVVNGVTGQVVALPAPLIAGYTQDHGPLTATLDGASHAIQHATVTYTKLSALSRASSPAAVSVDAADYYDFSQSQLDDGPRVRTQATDAVAVDAADYYDFSHSQLDDGPRVRTQATDAVSVDPADYYDFSQSQLDDGPRVRTQATNAVTVDAADYYDFSQSQLDDGPRVRTQATDAVSVDPADYYDFSRSQLDDGPRVRTQATDAVSVDPADYYDFSRSQLDDGPRVRTQATDAVSVDSADYYDFSHSQLDDGPRVRTQVPEGVAVTAAAYYDNRQPKTTPLANTGTTPATTPVKAAAKTPTAPTAKATQAAALPQTGNADNRSMAALGLVALGSLFALGATSKRREVR
ncbi:KxYKxGKxW signal peptide domain-containing protein [Lacticaseibacillus kribbianus]|uniref:KxYKxGKxW signal peptide domain-containing protein n=1 Tax=Lacticaseibacillus kribbianus TaxID=2926292 RepID=UPI001CD1E3D6|nr:KxYKxGKxW signal peptide domain-containing protein [Lacticaseibacillus kribbianus]